MLVTVVSAGTAVVYLAARVFRRHTGDHSGFLIAALSLGLLYGTGTSGGFATAGALNSGSTSRVKITPVDAVPVQLPNSAKNCSSLYFGKSFFVIKLLQSVKEGKFIRTF